MKRCGPLRLWSACVIAILAPTACAPGGAPAAETSSPTSGHAQARAYTYQCGGDYRFTVRFEGETARLSLPGRTVSLPQVVSASGARYSDGNVTYWSKGTKALLETPSARYRDCEGRPLR